MIGKLHCLVDNCVHLQQAAGTTMVGYNAYYTHKLAQPDGLEKYGCSRADKEFLTHNQRETERAILNLKAREKQLSSVSRRQGKSGCVSAGNVGGDGNPKSKSARSRHNKRQRELYQKCKKAKKAKQVKQAKDAAPGAAAVPPSQAGR